MATRISVLRRNTNEVYTEGEVLKVYCHGNTTYVKTANSSWVEEKKSRSSLQLIPISPGVENYLDRVVEEAYLVNKVRCKTVPAATPAFTTASF